MQLLEKRQNPDNCIPMDQIISHPWMDEPTNLLQDHDVEVPDQTQVE